MASKAGETVGPALASAGAAVAAGAQQVGEVVVEAGQAVGEGASNLATAATSDGGCNACLFYCYITDCRACDNCCPAEVQQRAKSKKQAAAKSPQQKAIARV